MYYYEMKNKYQTIIKSVKPIPRITQELLKLKSVKKNYGHKAVGSGQSAIIDENLGIYQNQFVLDRLNKVS